MFEIHQALHRAAGSSTVVVVAPSGLMPRLDVPPSWTETQYQICPVSIGRSAEVSAAPLYVVDRSDGHTGGSSVIVQPSMGCEKNELAGRAFLEVKEPVVGF